MSEGPKDFEKHVKTQLLRLSHLAGYPDAPVALRDYIAALAVAGYADLVTAVMDVIVGEELNRCPPAATVRRIAYEFKEKVGEKRAGCTICHGVGFETIWQLVTFHGQGFVIDKTETLPGITDQEQATAFAEKLVSRPGSARQTIQSAARMCQCHAGYTGPRSVAPAPSVVNCYRCQDFGVAESLGSEDLRSVASYCDCAAGQERKMNLGDQYNPVKVNEARRKLIAVSNRNRVNPSSKDSPMRNVAEVYSGGF